MKSGSKNGLRTASPGTVENDRDSNGMPWQKFRQGAMYAA
jgi:hypothetical protein